MKIFRNIIKDLKKNIKLVSIKDDQPPLCIDYPLLKKELENELYKNNVKKVQVNNTLRNQKEVKNYKRDFLIDKKNLSNIYEEFSEEELDELIHSEDSEELTNNSSET